MYEVIHYLEASCMYEVMHCLGHICSMAGTVVRVAVGRVSFLYLTQKGVQTGRWDLLVENQAYGTLVRGW